MSKEEKNQAAVELGKLGGKARNKKFTHEDFVKWGQLGKGIKKKKK